MGAVAEKTLRRGTRSGVRAKALPREVTGSHAHEGGDACPSAKGKPLTKPLPDTVWADEEKLGRRLSAIWKHAIATTTTQAAVARAAQVSEKTVSQWCNPSHPRSLPNARRVALIMRGCPRTYRAWRKLHEGLVRSITPAPTVAFGVARSAETYGRMAASCLRDDEDAHQAVQEHLDAVARLVAAR